MNKKKELVKNTAILTIGKVCTQFISFLLLPLYTALLPPADYGTIDLLNTYVTLLVPIFNLQLENGLFRFMVDCRGSQSKESKIFTTVFITNIVQILISVLFIVIIYTMRPFDYLWFVTISVSLTILLNTLLQFPRGIGNNVSYAVTSLFSAASNIMLNVFFIAILHEGLNGMLYATIISQLLTIFFLIISQKVWRYFAISLFDKNLWISIVKYSVPLVPGALSWWVLGASDRLVLSYFVDKSANGLYSIANKFSSVYLTLFNIFNLSWTESVILHFHEKDNEGFLSETINDMFKLFASICYVIITALQFLFPLLVNNSYSDAYNHIPILMLAGLFQVVIGLYSVIYIALKKSNEVAKTSVYAACINLLFDLLLVNHIKIYAASLSTLISFFVMAIYRYYHVRKFKVIKIEKRILLIEFSVGIIVLINYYSKNFILNVFGFVISLLVGFLLNKQMIISCLHLLRNKISKGSENAR